MMLTAIYDHACSTLNVGDGAFVVSVVPKLLPPCVIHCISENSIYLNRYYEPCRICMLYIDENNKTKVKQ